MSMYPSQYPEKISDEIFINFVSENSTSIEEKRHFHELHYEICFILSGASEYYFDFSKYILESQDCIFLDKKEIHFSLQKEENATKRVIVNFNDDFLRQYSLNWHFLKEIFEKPMFHIPSKSWGEISHLLTELVYEADYPSMFSSHLIRGNLYKLLITMYRIKTKTQFDKVLPTNQIIEAATKYICQNFSNRLTLDEVANFCHVNKYYLSKLFKKVMKVNFITYLNSIRVQNASLLLLESNDSILEISQKCGFNSQNHFCDVFRSVKGISARDFRNTNDYNSDKR